MEKEPFLRKIAENVRAEMHKANFSNADLARVCNISAGTVSKILKGSMNVSLSLAVSLAEGLGVSVNDLLEGVVDKKDIKKSQKASSSSTAMSFSIGILSINNRRITCLKDGQGKILGTSELECGLDLAETSNSLLNLIKESIVSALPNNKISVEKMNEDLKNATLNVVTQSYEFEESREKFSNFIRRYFKEVFLLSDWQLAYLSAFQDKPGISLIADKGVSLIYMHNGKLSKLGGWKFPVYDLGGENWLGIQTIQHTIDAAEGYIPMTDLAQNVLAKFNGKIERITEACFKGTKNHDVYSTFCEPLFKAYLTKDKAAIMIIEQGVSQIKRLINRADEIIGHPVKIALNGSLEKIYRPFLDNERLIGSPTKFEQADFLADLTEDYLSNYGLNSENAAYLSADR